jgi:hypothetical protein
MYDPAAHQHRVSEILDGPPPTRIPQRPVKRSKILGKRFGILIGVALLLLLVLGTVFMIPSSTTRKTQTLGGK